MRWTPILFDVAAAIVVWTAVLALERRLRANDCRSFSSQRAELPSRPGRAHVRYSRIHILPRLARY